jgi:hypothetical protein
MTIIPNEGEGGGRRGNNLFLLAYRYGYVGVPLRSEKFPGDFFGKKFFFCCHFSNTTGKNSIKQEGKPF